MTDTQDKVREALAAHERIGELIEALRAQHEKELVILAVLAWDLVHPDEVVRERAARIGVKFLTRYCTNNL